MIKIGEAYRVGKKMRNTNGLDVARLQVRLRRSYSKMQGESVVAIADIDGGSRPHRAKIAWPRKRGRDKMVKVFRKDKREGVAALRKSDYVKLTCDCEDFRFTFYPAIEAEGGQLKDFPHYEPKGTGVPRAIDKPGMCKHLLHLVNELRQLGYIK